MTLRSPASDYIIPCNLEQPDVGWPQPPGDAVTTLVVPSVQDIDLATQSLFYVDMSYSARGQAFLAVL